MTRKLHWVAPAPIPIAPGLRFGRLTVLEQAGLTSSGFFGNAGATAGIFHTLTYKLPERNSEKLQLFTKRVGHKYNTKDVKGQRFGRLTPARREKDTKIAVS